jgi:hypothetical protein
VRELLRGDIFAHAVEDHGTDQGGRALEDGHREVGDTGVSAVVGGDFSAPNLAQLAALVRETDHKNQDLLAAGVGEGNFGVVERFGSDGRDGLGERESGGEEEKCGNFEYFHRRVPVPASSCAEFIVRVVM